MVYKVADAEDLKSQLEAAGNKLVIIDFFATWCGPCKAISPKLEELSNTYADKLVVIKVDVDECEDVAADYNISSMPTFIFVKNSKQVDMFSGANPAKLEEKINQLS